MVHLLARRSPIAITSCARAKRNLFVHVFHFFRRSYNLYYFSLGVLAPQLFIIIGFLWRLAEVRQTEGTLPWWHDLHGVVLLAVEAGFALFFGTIVLVFEFMTDLVWH